MVPLRPTHTFESGTVEGVFVSKDRVLDGSQEELTILLKECIICEAYGDERVESKPGLCHRLRIWNRHIQHPNPSLTILQSKLSPCHSTHWYTHHHHADHRASRKHPSARQVQSYLLTFLAPPDRKIQTRSEGTRSRTRRRARADLLRLKVQNGAAFGEFKMDL